MKLKILLLFILLVGCVNESVTINFEPSVEIVPVDNPVILIEDSVNISESSPEIIQKVLPKFHYQLGDVDFNNLVHLDVDYLIVDVDDSGFTKTDINILNQDKKVFSYLSIGQAENYRAYWMDYWTVGYPNFIEQEDPTLSGNFIIKYWDQDWQDIILVKIREIASKGYDGIYLDNIDAYENFDTRRSAEIEMVDFVAKIKQQVKAMNSDMFIFVNDGEGLYGYVKYKNSIDGVGSESTWYSGNTDQLFDAIQQKLKYLDRARRDGKVVLAIEYPTEEHKICTFYEKCTAQEFSCAVSNKELNLSAPIVC